MWLDSLLLLVLAICVVTDLHNRKIYNFVLGPGYILAFASHFYFDGWGGLSRSLLGFIVGLVLLLIPYLLGGMGAGDVKLLALIGALKGTTFVLTTSVYMALLGGVIAILILLCRKGCKQRIMWMFIALQSLRYGVKMPLVLDDGTLKTTYPYGVAIAGGALLCLWLKGGFV